MHINTTIINAITALMNEIPGHAVPLLDLIDKHVWDGKREILSITCDDNDETYVIVTTDKIFQSKY